MGCVAAGHAALFVASGWIARRFLVLRTLDGERQTVEQWTALLHAMLLRSGLVACAALGVVFVLLSLRRTREAIDALFRAEAEPTNLAVFRIVSFAAFFLVFDPNQLLFFSRLPRSLVEGLHDPLPLWRILVPEPSIAPPLVRLFFGACFLACIGLFTRAAALTTCVLGFYLLGLPQVFGKVDHYHHMLWFALVLAMSPCGDALGVDALLRSCARGGRTPERVRRKAYALPLTLVWLLFGVIYFWPGFWKLVQHGSAWVFSDNLTNHLYLKWFEDETFTPIFRIDRHPTLCHTAALAVIVFELSFVFLVPFAKTRPLAVFMGLMFHNMTYLFMNIGFLSLQLAYVAFLDWSGIFRWLSDHAVPAPARRAASALAARFRAASVRAAETPSLAAALAAIRSSDQPERGMNRGLVIAGVGLLTITMGYGAIHHTDGWPFACYPTFSSLIRRERKGLVVKVASASKGARRVDTARLLDAFRSERYAAVQRDIVAERDPDRRRDMLTALARIVESLDPSIGPGDTIVIAEAVFSTDPDTGRAPQREVLLGAFDVGGTTPSIRATAEP